LKQCEANLHEGFVGSVAGVVVATQNKTTL